MDDERTIHVSAKTGVNLDTLLEAIDRHLPGDPVQRVRIRVPQSEGKVLAMLEGKARILSRQYVDGAVELDRRRPGVAGATAEEVSDRRLRLPM